ncbi:MAG: twin-arginine translocation signal domain-containing protein [Opitutus sp.]|nr:twin-arginine translocation signal domain-containing protein [Opitutus sp.]
MSKNSLNRRDFITFSAMAAAMLGLPACQSLAKNPRKPRPIAAGAKVRVAQIGCGGKGFSDIMAHKDEEVVALCDIDWVAEDPRGAAANTAKGPVRVPNVKKLMQEFPKAKRYTDFRKMLIEMDDQIDAVGVATPDHMHFLPAYLAIMMGKHVYVQKPLTQTVGEARELLRLARLNGVCTQMGNQGHAGEGIRLVREWFEAGVLGDVREVNIWTNRPATTRSVVWPQGMKEWPKADPVPEGFSQDLFLGRAQERTFSKAIHPFKWRGYRDYGCGALGDMACHLMDASYWGLQLGAPTSVELKKIDGLTAIAYPKSAVVEFQFPARGKLPPVKVTWHEGGEKPAKPTQLEATRELAQGGQLIVGSKGTVYDGNDYCNSPRFIPEALHKELTPSFPAKTFPRVPENNPHKEWIAGIRANNPKHAGSNFEYSVPFTEMVCLGTVSILVGQKFTWDSDAMKTSLPEANALLYPTYRKGWSMSEIA